MDAKPGQVTVVAPHPDDEVLGAGGALARWAHTGTAITIVAVTDGERSHPDSPTWSTGAMACQRRVESDAAWGRLGLDCHHVVRLGVRDGEVTDSESELATVLVRLSTPDSLLLATWPGDGHPDHEAAGRATRRAAELVGCEHAFYPVWMWHWASPDDPRVPWQRARSIVLELEFAAAKRLATGEFVSQTRPLSAHPEDRPVLPRYALDRLLREFEVFFV